MDIKKYEAFLVSAESGSFSGSVSVGAYPYLASSWIPHILKEFSLVYPNINIIVQEGSYLQLDEWMTLNRRVKCINFEEDLNTELGILVPKTKTCPITWRLIRFINGLFNE